MLVIIVAYLTRKFLIYAQVAGTKNVQGKQLFKRGVSC